MDGLEGLAQKELDGQPFTAEEEQFLRQVIVIRHWPAGCMSAPPGADYEGWYPRLFYAGQIGRTRLTRLSRRSIPTWMGRWGRRSITRSRCGPRTACHCEPFG